jgi:hypothetical protein
MSALNVVAIGVHRNHHVQRSFGDAGQPFRRDPMGTTIERQPDVNPLRNK